MNLIFRLRVYLAGIFYYLSMRVAPPVPVLPLKSHEVAYVYRWDGHQDVLFKITTTTTRVPGYEGSFVFWDPYYGALREPFRFPAANRVADKNPSPH